MSDLKSDLVVDATHRFVVVGPGHPHPNVIAAGSSNISDLVGFYSLQEAGFGSLIGGGYNLDFSPTLFDIFGPPPKRTGPPFLSFDVWIQGADDREERYALIVATEGINGAAMLQVDEFRKPISETVKDIKQAYDQSSLGDLKYNLNIINTAISLMVQKANLRAERIDRRRRITVNILVLYSVIFVLIITFSRAYGSFEDLLKSNIP